jgi:hypothetical protein
MLSWSREKRLRIRPTGVVSKKAIGARMTCSSVVSCSKLDAFSPPKKMEKDPMKEPTDAASDYEERREKRERDRREKRTRKPT